MINRLLEFIIAAVVIINILWSQLIYQKINRLLNIKKKERE